MAKQICNSCGSELIDDHPASTCVGVQLFNAQEEIKKLKISVIDWKNAWFALRDIIAKLWWDHPAINNDDQRIYYQAMQKERDSNVQVQGK